MSMSEQSVKVTLSAKKTLAASLVLQWNREDRNVFLQHCTGVELVGYFVAGGVAQVNVLYLVISGTGENASFVQHNGVLLANNAIPMYTPGGYLAHNRTATRINFGGGVLFDFKNARFQVFAINNTTGNLEEFKDFTDLALEFRLTGHFTTKAIKTTFS